MNTPEDDQKYILLDYLRSAVKNGKFSGIHSVENLIGKLGTIHIIRHGETQANAEKRINWAAEHIPETPYSVSTDQPYDYFDKGKAGLTAKGTEQIETVTRILQAHSQRPTVMIVSPQERAYETGRIAAQGLGIHEMIVSPEVREREFGPYAGILIKDIEALSESRNAALLAKQSESSATSKHIYKSFVPDELIGAFNDSGIVTSHWFNQTPKFPNEDAGETFPQSQRRIVNAIVNVLSEHFGQNIAIATHGDVARMASAACKGIGWKELLIHYQHGLPNGNVLSFDMNEVVRDLLQKEKVPDISLSPPDTKAHHR